MFLYTIIVESSTSKVQDSYEMISLPLMSEIYLYKDLLPEGLESNF